jgi:hypothetical protein
VTIPPGDTYAWEVAPSAIWGEREWQGVPEPNTGELVTLSAVLQIKATDASQERGVWTGHITSESIEVLIVQPGLQTPHQYLWEGCPNQALKLMQAEPAWIHKVDEDECTPLHHAARFGFLKVGRWLLDHGAEVNARAYNNLTALHLAERPEMVSLLVERKANVDAESATGTPLLSAVARYAHAEQSEDATRRASVTTGGRSPGYCLNPGPTTTLSPLPISTMSSTSAPWHGAGGRDRARTP